MKLFDENSSIVCSQYEYGITIEKYKLDPPSNLLRNSSNYVLEVLNLSLSKQFFYRKVLYFFNMKLLDGNLSMICSQYEYRITIEKQILDSPPNIYYKIVVVMFQKF